MLRAYVCQHTAPRECSCFYTTIIRVCWACPYEVLLPFTFTLSVPCRGHVWSPCILYPGWASTWTLGWPILLVDCSGVTDSGGIRVIIHRKRQHVKTHNFELHVDVATSGHPNVCIRHHITLRMLKCIWDEVDLNSPPTDPIWGATFLYAFGALKWATWTVQLNTDRYLCTIFMFSHPTTESGKWPLVRLNTGWDLLSTGVYGARWPGASVRLGWRSRVLQPIWNVGEHGIGSSRVRYDRGAPKDTGFRGYCESWGDKYMVPGLWGKFEWSVIIVVVHWTPERMQLTLVSLLHLA